MTGEEFVGYVAHELRTPLTSIKLYLELLEQDSGLTDSQRELVGNIVKANETLITRLRELRQEAKTKLK